MSTRMKEGLLFNTDEAAICHPELIFRKKASAKRNPTGSPIANCFRNFFCFCLFNRQYSINFLSSAFNIPQNYLHLGLLVNPH